MAVVGWNPAEYTMHQQSRRDDMMRNLLNMFLQKKQFDVQDRRYQDQLSQQQKSNEMAQKKYELDVKEAEDRAGYYNRPQTSELSSDAKMMEYFIKTGQAKDHKEARELLMETKNQGGITPSLAFNMGRKGIEDERFADTKATNEARYRQTQRDKKSAAVYKMADTRVRNELDKLDRILAKDTYTLKNRPKLEIERDNLQKALDFVTSAGIKSQASGGMSPDTEMALQSIVSDMPRVKSGDFLTDISEKLVGGTASQTPTGVPPEVKAYMKKHPEVPADEVMAMYTEYMKIKK